MADDGWTPDFGTLDRSAPQWAPKRPVRIAVLGDFSAGAASGRLDTGDELARRKAIPVEFDNLEDTLARLNVKLNLPIGDEGAGVELEFADLDAFHPDTLYRNLDMFRALGDLRKRLNNTATFAKAAAEVTAMSGGAVKRASRSGRGRARSASPAANGKLSDFARLVGYEAEVDVATPVDALLRQIVGPFVQKAPDPKREAMVAVVDNALSDAMRAVLHQSEFQNLESLWRGLDLVLRRIETGPMLQVHLIDMSAEEFAADLSSVSDLSETGLYSLLVDKPSQDKTGGYALVCGLFQFESTPPHAELLGRMAKIAAQAGAPFVTSMALDAFTDRRHDPHPLVAEAMQALRAMPEAPYLALLGPRFMLRHPYGKRSDPISAFSFEEFTASDGLRGMLWGHPALVAASIMAAPTGKTLSMGDLPFYYFTDSDGDQVALPCTERLINTEVALRLKTFGLVALLAHKGQPELRLAGMDAIDGSQLGLQLEKRASAKISVSTKATITPKEDAPVAKAKGGKPKAADDDEDSPSSDSSSDDDTATSDTDSSSDTSSDTSSDDLDALLASLGDSGDGAAPAEEAPAEAAAGGEEEMDPDLAALLKSLEG
jgi:type VI secretion system protein ImpC